jgi:hypothetical protein
MNEAIVVAAAVSLAALWLILRGVRRWRAIVRGQSPGCSGAGCPHRGTCGHSPGETKEGGPPCSH